MVGIFDIADAFFDAVVSAWLEYLISQMLFRCGGICKSGVFAVADAFSLPLMYNCIFNLLIP